MEKTDAKFSLTPLADLQPSQLFINQEKLEALQSKIDFNNPECIPPIPIKHLDDEWIMTDGHTRAFAAFLAGLDKVPTFLDEDALDWAAYRICVDWCHEAGIEETADLLGRVIDADAYQIRWIDRCRQMQDDLASKR
jgi:hypothetical protein